MMVHWYYTPVDSNQFQKKYGKERITITCELNMHEAKLSSVIIWYDSILLPSFSNVKVLEIIHILCNISNMCIYIYIKNHLYLIRKSYVTTHKIYIYFHS